MYNGHHRIIDVFRRKSIPMIHAARSWIYPLPMIPFMTPLKPPPPPSTTQPALLALMPPSANKTVNSSLEELEEQSYEMQLYEEGGGRGGVLSARSEDSVVSKAVSVLPQLEDPKIGGPDSIVDMLMACRKGYKERASDDFVVHKGWVEHTDDDSNWSIALRKTIKAWDDVCHVSV
jgi:hypothetical protein